MKGFPGFPDGKLRLTQVPNLFFSDLLPIIDNVSELKVTLYAFWALAHKEGQVRFLRLVDFLSDEQKRDILYNNAARFLRLSEEQIAEHHGRR